MTLLTINTNNQEGYIDWARKSADALAAANGATAMGACTPRAGAEYQGIFTFGHSTNHRLRHGNQMRTARSTGKSLR